MKILIHNIYITNKIVYKPAAFIELFLRNYDLRKGYKHFHLKYLWNLWTNHSAQRTRPRAIQNLPPQWILKRLRQFYSRNRWMYKTDFIHFSGFTFFNKKWTVIARKLIFFRKCRYFNGLSNTADPIQIHIISDT